MQDGGQVHGGVARVAQPSGVCSQLQQAVKGAAVAFHHGNVQRRHFSGIAAVEARTFGQQLARLRQITFGCRLI